MSSLQEHTHELKRDPAIELARLIGCLTVIGCHTYLPIRVNEQLEPGRLFFCMLFADGVSIFWLIGGAFLFNYSDYKKVLISRIKKVLLPMFLVGLLYFFFSSYAGGNRTIHDLFFNNESAYRNIFNNLLKWENGISGYNHSWYVYVYMLLMLILPILKGIVTFADRSPHRKLLLISGIILFLTLNDFSSNRLARFSHNSFHGLTAAALITLIGYYLYQFREFFRKKIFLFIAPAVFIVTNILREIIQLHREAAGYIDDTSIIFWYSVLGVTAAACVVVFCLSLIQDRKATSHNRLICYLASYTFPIYLIHLLIKSIYDHFRVTQFLQKYILAWNDGPAGEAVYMVIIIPILFLSSFFVVFIFRRLTKLRELKQ